MSLFGVRCAGLQSSSARRFGPLETDTDRDFRRRYATHLLNELWFAARHATGRERGVEFLTREHPDLSVLQDNSGIRQAVITEMQQALK